MRKPPDRAESDRKRPGAGEYPAVRFSAPWGRALRWISAGATILLLGLSIALALGPVAAVPDPGAARWLLLAAIVPALIALGALPFLIRGYSVLPGELRIHRLGWDSRIALRGLASAEPVPNAMARSLRLMGNGGLYSFSGWWMNRSLGRYRAFVTDGARTVVLRWPARTIVVSPVQPREFAAAALAAARADAGGRQDRPTGAPNTG